MFSLDLVCPKTALIALFAVLGVGCAADPAVCIVSGDSFFIDGDTITCRVNYACDDGSRYEVDCNGSLCECAVDDVPQSTFEQASFCMPGDGEDRETLATTRCEWDLAF